MSDTPRTDSLRNSVAATPTALIEMTIHARQLERELAEARESKNRIAKRAEAIRCELVEMEKQRDTLAKGLDAANQVVIQLGEQRESLMTTLKTIRFSAVDDDIRLLADQALNSITGKESA